MPHFSEQKFYHAVTHQPIDQDQDFCDSDQEVDDQWILAKSAKELTDFDDVKKPDISFMQLWNAYVFKHPPYGDQHLPTILKEFWAQVGNQEMYPQFLLHLLTLWEHGLVPDLDLFLRETTP